MRAFLQDNACISPSPRYQYLVLITFHFQPNMEILSHTMVLEEPGPTFSSRKPTVFRYDGTVGALMH